MLTQLEKMQREARNTAKDHMSAAVLARSERWKAFDKSGSTIAFTRVLALAHACAASACVKASELQSEHKNDESDQLFSLGERAVSSYNVNSLILP